MQKVDFVNLGRQYILLKDEILEAFDRVSSQGSYVMGPDLEQFEEEFAAYCGTKYAIGLGNGSDALHLPLLSLGIGPGDEVITAPNSFIASAWVVARTGARLVFADVGEDMNLDPEKVEAAITDRTRAILVVHLTGRIANMEALEDIGRRKGVMILEDAAQAVGARRGGKRAGAFGRFAGFSLHPLKNLHTHGDSGVCVTDDTELAASLLQWRNHGLINRNECEFWGVNSRMDSIQAAIACIKLKRLDGWNDRYRKLAAFYTTELKGFVQVPSHGSDEEPVYHRYMIRHDERDALQSYLAENGIGTAVNYPIPLHLQPAAKDLGYLKGAFPVAEKLSDTILSLPLYPELRDDEAERVVSVVKSFKS